MSKFAVVNEIKRHIDAWLSLVERCIRDVKVQVKFHIFGVWLSLVERYVRDVEVAGSNPVTPIFP